MDSGRLWVARRSSEVVDAIAEELEDLDPAPVGPVAEEEGMSDLVELARRYVALSDELEAVRGQIKLAVVNGSGGEPSTAPFVKPARSPGGKSKAEAQANHPNALKAAEVERKIIALLKLTPGMRTTEDQQCPAWLAVGNYTCRP